MAKLNRDKIIQAIIEEKYSFFNFLDYINDHDSGGEIPQKLYQQFYVQEIINNRVKHDSSKAYLLQVFDVRSMIENGIFYEIRSTGHYAFNNLILDLLNFLDTKRSKQLFDAQFDHLRKSTRDYCNLITSLPVGTEDQIEAISGFRGLLNEIDSKVRENTCVLQGKVEAFAAEYTRYEAGSSTLSINDLFIKVDNLFHRNVKPFLDFTTTEKIVTSGSFAEAMSSIISYFDDQENVDLARSLSFRKTAITSYYKDIRKTSDTLQVYLDQLGKDKSDYLTIENAYAKLIESLELLRHGGAKNIKLKPDAQFFKELTVFDGLSTHKQKYATRLNLQPEGNLDRFEWHLERLQSKPLLKKVEIKKPLPGNSYVGLDRKVMIAQFVYKISIPSTMDDVVDILHSILLDRLPNYSLTDFLYALEVWLPRLKGFTQGTNGRGLITDENYYFDYSVLKYEKVM